MADNNHERPSIRHKSCEWFPVLLEPYTDTDRGDIYPRSETKAIERSLHQAGVGYWWPDNMPSTQWISYPSKTLERVQDIRDERKKV